MLIKWNVLPIFSSSIIQKEWYFPIVFTPLSVRMSPPDSMDCMCYVQQDSKYPVLKWTKRRFI